MTIHDVFEAMVSHPSHGSKSAILNHYDKSVMGNTIVEPGDGDAGVIEPLSDLQSYVHHGKHPGWDLSDDQKKIGVALSAGGNGRYGRISPYLQGVNAVWETVRNVASTGAQPRALTDCLNYGNPEIPEQLWELEEGVRGITDAARKITVDGEHIPIISGNVSLYNTTSDGAIDPTAIVAAVGVMNDAERALPIALQEAGHELFLLGNVRDECGGSAYYDLLESLTDAAPDSLLGANVPNPDFKEATAMLAFLGESMQKNIIASCHDVSEGGLLLALFEMTLPFRGKKAAFGMDINLDALPNDLRTDTLLFSESGTCILAIDPSQKKLVQNLAEKHQCTLKSLGAVTQDNTLTIRRNGTHVLASSLPELQNHRMKALDAMKL
jgi:phosphoribosylformylglycinamidine synthase